MSKMSNSEFKVGDVVNYVGDWDFITSVVAVEKRTDMYKEEYFYYIIIQGEVLKVTANELIKYEY